jgi:hypothetical protein
MARGKPSNADRLQPLTAILGMPRPLVTPAWLNAGKCHVPLLLGTSNTYIVADALRVGG